MALKSEHILGSFVWVESDGIDYIVYNHVTGKDVARYDDKAKAEAHADRLDKYYRSLE